ncbi:MAG TPA: DNA polymerase III subunit gamma/tau [Gammaproteobacteria bacterium]|nr:DNA polymerase III subunit gamma/tau [Gammaproteobacteria bacterium]
MNYQVLARKWRPKDFSEMVGQEHVIRALVNALDNDRLHHAFLFTGTRGVGKTTIGRILAKSLNCETGISSTPCGTCSACQEIDEGRFIDLIEVDAASRTKVEDTRELLENVQYAPTRGRFKVYLIDEVHMLSNHSFNALLKTLEEPPPHVKFLLATTDPQKLPVTILSRCLQFNLKRLPLNLIAEHLQYILGQEKVDFEKPAVLAIANAADGSMRDALSLLDQAIAYGGGKVVASDVHDMLGTIEQHHVEKILRAVISGNATQVLDEVNSVAEKSPDYQSVLADLVSLLHRVAVAQMVPEAIDENQGGREAVLSIAQSIPAEDVQLYYQIALIGKRDLPLTTDMKAGLEMVLLRMIAFRPYEVNTPAPVGQGRNQGQVSNTVAPPASETSGIINEEKEKTVTESAETPGQYQKSGAGAPGSDSEWTNIVESLGLKAMAKELATHCIMEGREAGQIRLRLDPVYEQTCTKSASQRLEQALSSFFGETVRVDIKTGKSRQETPAAQHQRVKNEKQEEAVDSIKNDPFIQELQEVFNADLDSAVIRPSD